MNKINQNGLQINQTEDYIEVNGIKYPIPEKVKLRNNKIIIVNGKIMINGYILNPYTGSFTHPYKLYFILVALAIAIYLVLFSSCMHVEKIQDWQVQITYTNGDTEERMFYNCLPPRVTDKGCVYDIYYNTYICGVRSLHRSPVEN